MVRRGSDVTGNENEVWGVSFQASFCVAEQLSDEKLEKSCEIVYIREEFVQRQIIKKGNNG